MSYMHVTIVGKPTDPVFDTTDGGTPVMTSCTSPPATSRRSSRTSSPSSCTARTPKNAPRPSPMATRFVNILVLWNTRYTDAALAHLRTTEAEVNPIDVTRLSPLVDAHIHYLGRYRFALDEAVMRGELRPFHSPDLQELNW